MDEDASRVSPHFQIDWHTLTRDLASFFPEK